MGVRHRKYTIEAVQYHPESVLSESGDDLMRNFLNLTGGTWEENPSVRVHDLSLPPFPIDLPNGKPAPKQSNHLPTILDKIHTQRLKDIDVAKATPGTTPADLDTLLALNLAPPLIDVVDRMRTTPSSAPALMAEIKRASPSKGPIAMRTNAAQQALTYALSGASVISVLTEPTWFKGSLLDMRLARQAIDALPNRPAILRKDFIVSEYQIAEARLHGADTVLLIVALLPPQRLHALYAYSIALGMEPLVEVNNAAEMECALELGAKLVGVNNRNLHNFEVDMNTTSSLADMVRGRGIVLCALSGITTHADVKTYVDQGVSAVLVGEALMRAKDTSAFIRELLGWPVQEKAEQPDQPPLVKICGIRTVAEAIAAASAGADMLGLMFVPTSKRRISLDVASRISYEIRAARAQLEARAISSSLELAQAHERSQPVGTSNEPWFAAHARRLSAGLAAGHSRPLLVGVFQDQPLEYVLEVVAAAQLDMVQLHGREPLHWASHIPVPVIRVFHVGAKGKGVEGIARPGLHKFVLLDSVRDAEGEETKGLSGGSGKVVDLELARRVVEAGEVGSSAPASSVTNGNANVNGHTTAPAPSRAYLPIILAGGLTPSNVAKAIAHVRPWAVDVSGGVENADGVGKDVEKIVAFVRAAKGIPDEEVSKVDVSSKPKEGEVLETAEVSQPAPVVAATA